MYRPPRNAPDAPAEQGKLTSRPTPPAETTAGLAGERPLGLGDKRDGLLYVPESVSPERPAPLMLVLHGAGGTAAHGLGRLYAPADEHGIILLSVDSRRATWDVIHGAYGPDVAFIDAALAQVFARYAVDPARIAAEGFSDGATYALSLGVTNGDLFSHIIAFSPGFVSPGEIEGKPPIFISHGEQDEVLNIDRCSRRLVPSLKRAGYDINYHEFAGPHTVPPEIVREAINWFLK